jgi:hypothetical protein
MAGEVFGELDPRARHDDLKTVVGDADVTELFDRLIIGHG